MQKWPKPQTGHGKPTVLVGIVTRNRGGILPRAIESAQSQSYQYVDVAVLDDGSEDGTSQLRSKYPAVHWCSWQPSRGYIEARNQLMRNTNAEYYLSLDDDAWFVSQDEISVALGHMEANQSVAAVAFDILSPDHPLPTPGSVPLPVSMFIGCGHLVRISAVRDAGFYVPGPGLYGSEEKDLCVTWVMHTKSTPRDDSARLVAGRQ
jgi:glycosyltransferase involved in cell wall biosynthesis